MQELSSVEPQVGGETSLPCRRRTLGLARAGRRLLPPVVTIFVILLIWELYVRWSGIRPTTLPTPSRVVTQLVLHWPVLWRNALPTLEETLLGFAFSMVAAFVASVVIDFSDLMRRALMPVFIISQTLPIVAIAPLVILWFGFGIGPKILLVGLVTFFPMLVALVQGYAATEPDLQMLMRTMGAGRRKIFLSARLPSAVPYFFTGLRIAITYAVVGAIFAEYAGAAKGLGIYMLSSKNSFRSDLVLAAVVLTGLLTLLLFAVAVLAERLAMPWMQIRKGEAE